MCSVRGTKSATMGQVRDRSEDSGSEEQDAHGSEAPRASVGEGRQTGRVLTNAELESKRDIVNTMRHLR